jgi:hypothetical protein
MIKGRRRKEEKQLDSFTQKLKILVASMNKEKRKHT